MIYNYFRQIEASKPSMNIEMLEKFEIETEKAEPANMLTLWQMLRDNPLEERPLLQWEANRQVAQRYMLFMVIAAGVSVIGLAMAIAGSVMRPTPHMRPAARGRQR
jgi:hypothetical protein